MQIICINVCMKKLNRLYIILVIVTVSLLAVVWYAASRMVTPVTTTDKVSIVTTLYTWQYLAERIGGDYVTVTNIVPPGAEPHDFAPLPQDIAAVYSSDLFIMNGAGIEPWAETLTNADFSAPHHITLEMTADTALLAAVPESAKDEANGAEADAEAVYSEFDPHIWLDPTIVKAKATTLRDTLSQLDPAHTAEYVAKTAVVVADLEALDDSIVDGLAQCELDSIIVSHNAFTYFGQRYTITLLPILGINPNATPSARTLAELSDLAQTESIDTIFFETLTSPDLAQTLADEIGAQTLVLNPLEGLTVDQTAQGEDYFSMMEQNLQNLQTALHCQK